MFDACAARGRWTRRPPLRAFACTLFLVLAASGAFADTARTTVDRVLVWNRPAGVAVVVTQLGKDQVVEVVRQAGDWYEIVLPGGPPNSRQTGFIRTSQAIIESRGPVSERARAAAVASQEAPRAARRHPGFASLDAAYRLAGTEVVRDSDAFEDVYAEAGRLSARYTPKAGIGGSFVAGQTFWGPLGIGVGVGYHQYDAPAKVEALVPHPFFFNQPRAATFETGPLSTTELAVHVPAVFMPAPDAHVRVVAFGGPTIFRVRQRAVTGATLNDPYPHNAVTVTGGTTEELEGTMFGYHAGADVSVFFTRSIGAGAGIRVSRAALDFKDDENASTSGHAGGVEVLAGLRFKF